MTSIANGEDGLSVRTKLNAALAVTDAVSFATRAAFVSANTANPGIGLSDGQIAVAGGYEYRRLASSTAISDLAGWVPNGDWDYKHFGSVGDGVTNDAPAMQSAMTAAANRTITRSAGTYLLNSNVLGDLTQTEIIEPNANTTGAGIVSNRAVLRIHEGGGTTQTRRGEVFASDTVGAFEEYRSLETVGNYGRRTNFWQTATHTTGFAIGHGIICDFDGTDGGQGLASWLVAATPASATKIFGVFGQEVNPVNISSDMGYARRRGLLARWTGGIQVVPEAKNLTRGGPNIGRNTTYGFAVTPSNESNDLSKKVKTYNGFLAEEGSIAPGGRAFLASGSATAADLPAFALQIDAHFAAGIDTQDATFSTGRALTVASRQLVQWGTTGFPVQLDGDSANARLDVEVEGNVNFRVERGAASVVNYITARGNATGGVPNLTAEGADTNIGLRVSTKGTGTFSINGNSATVAQFSNVASAVNSFNIFGNTTGSAPTVAVIGSDTNIDLRLTTKGTGVLRFGTHTASSDAAVSGYIEVKDAGGTVRKLAVIT